MAKKNQTAKVWEGNPIDPHMFVARRIVDQYWPDTPTPEITDEIWDHTPIMVCVLSAIKEGIRMAKEGEA